MIDDVAALRSVALAAAVAMTGCRVEFGPPPAPQQSAESPVPSGELWIYTSMYQEVVDRATPVLQARLPGVDLRWYQAGSEKVAQRFEAESAAGGSPACVLLTSDPFWYVRLADEGRLLPHFAPNVLEIDRGFVDPKARWTAARLSLMVLGVNATAVPNQAFPRRFADLTDPAWRDRVTTSDPLSSGTAFTTFSFFEESPGPTYVDALHGNGLVAAGGNSAVLARVESAERPVGILLLENLLAAKRKGSPVDAVFPADGAIVVPGPVAITKDCRNPSAARAFVDALLSPEGQQAIVAGDMYSVLPSLPPPVGAPPLDTIATRAWEFEFTARVANEQASRKQSLMQRLAGN